MKEKETNEGKARLSEGMEEWETRVTDGREGWRKGDMVDQGEKLVV